MKRFFLILLIGLLITGSVMAQSEYRYIALRFGFSNGFSGQPNMNVNKYLAVPSDFLTDAGVPIRTEEMQLKPLGSYSGYTPGFNASLLYHFDFDGDVAGIFTGLDYNFTGISSKYETQHGNHYLQETHRMHMVGLPLAFKYGPDIWDTQRYAYIGAQINYIAAMSAIQKVDWETTPSSTKLEAEEYKKTAFNLFVGFNWKFVNLQFDYFPASVFDNTFEENGYSKYDGQVESSFAIKIGVNVPYGWLSEQSFWWRRKLRKFPLWK